MAEKTQTFLEVTILGLAEITGDAVRLRAYRSDDAEALATGYADPAAARAMPEIPVPFTLRHAERMISEGVPAIFAEGGAAWAIADPGTDELLGGVALHDVRVARGQAEIGYWVGPWARRRGVATAAVRALTAHALSTGLSRIELLTHWENGPSQRVALAAGYRREGVRRDAIADRSGGRDDLIAFARVAADSGEPVPRPLPDLPGGELTDGVVTLRPLGPGDVGFLGELRRLPEIVGTSVPPVSPSDADLRMRCGHAEAHWLSGSRADMVVEDCSTGLPAGEIGLFYANPVLQEAMIGYGMLPGYRGRGFMTRAAQLVALWTFAETDVARLIAGTDPGNRASQRVLEKAGFKREAHMIGRLPGADGRRHDDVQYLLRAEDLLTEGPRLDG